MKHLLLAALLFSTPAYAIDTAYLGYWTQHGTQFFGISPVTLRTETIPLNKLTQTQRQAVVACMASLNTDKAVQMIVDFVPQFSSDVRTIDPWTGLPNGFSGIAVVVKSVSCTTVGSQFPVYWRTQLAKSKNRRH